MAHNKSGNAYASPPPCRTLALIALFGAPLAPSLAYADVAPFEATTLSLSATGEAQAAPDIASINIGVESTGATAADALRANAAQMTAAISALKTRGVAAKDIQTSGLNLSAQYVFHDNEPRRLTGYQASNTITVTVRDLTHLGATVDSVVAAGANQINGVGFGLADPHAAEDAARKAAVKALQSKAALYAEATGYRVERLVSLSDGGNEGGPARPMMMSAMRKVSSTPTEPGELNVTASVTGVFELKK